MASFMIQCFRRMTKDDNGSAITEYAVVIGLILVRDHRAHRELRRACWPAELGQRALDGREVRVHTPTTPIRYGLVTSDSQGSFIKRRASRSQCGALFFVCTTKANAKN
jgi:hypothetical protein